MPKIITSSLIAMLTDFWSKRCQFKNHVHFDEEKGIVYEGNILQEPSET